MTGTAPERPALRRRYVYHGRVQGVGFRATTYSIARRHPVAGYVRNCADGTVELVLEGSASAIADVVAELDRAMRGYVERRDDRELDSAEKFDGFEIRR